jgi:hypothetical protein
MAASTPLLPCLSIVGSTFILTELLAGASQDADREFHLRWKSYVLIVINPKIERGL